jgi:serine/threonine protein kinase
MIGKTLIHYEISAQIGRGGMGEVYQAKDTKLGRDVAIKVLPEEFALDTDRVARFQREAKLLASLNHPNIAAIYGLEESDGTHFLVMELIEGQTLKDRIKAGPIPVEEALRLALQMAEALEAAHENGVIHRDLKPANIKVTPDGKVKILDFGLAKAYAGDQGDISLADSPTISAAATQKGVILGTAAYMSPEQAKGKTVDKRADIWAFGVVLFEMLTGKSLFSGEDVSSTLARVLEREPDFSTLPQKLHPRIQLMLERCLKKDPKDRYSGISDARVDIQSVLADPSGVFAQAATLPKPKRRLRLGLSWMAASIGLAAIVAGSAVWYLKPVPPVERPKVVRFDYELPESQRFSNLTSECLATSPDGTQIAYSTSKGIYLLEIRELAARFISGTDEQPEKPFFSPDGKWIGYWSNASQQLKKIAIGGGASVPLTDEAAFGVYSWGADDKIVYSQGRNFKRLSANGGTSEIFANLETATEFNVSPHILPDGKSVLFTRVLPLPEKIMVHSLESGETKELFEGDTACYLPTGHIIYTVRDNLTAVPFELERLEVTGGPIPIIEGVYETTGPQYAISDSGLLVYIPRIYAAGTGSRTLVWVDRAGKETPLGLPSDEYVLFKISPDGKNVALGIGSVGISTIWKWDFARQTKTRLTFSEGANNFPIWTPDSQKIIFTSLGEGARAGLYMKSADGTGEEKSLFGINETYPLPESWSSDGKTLALTEISITNMKANIGVLSMENEGTRKLVLEDKYSELQPQISPNGRWMAYVSDESGQHEIFVRPFPDVNKGKWQVSEGGGHSPLWSPDGRELFYRNGESVMVASVETESSFSFGSRKNLFRGTYVSEGYGGVILRCWDLHPDGKRFLMMKELPGDAASYEASQQKFNVVVNWFEELKERVPVD